MPLVTRKIKEDLEHLYTQHVGEHVLYVRPRDKQPGDVVVPIETIPDEMLADLALTHPNEYAKAAAARNVTVRLHVDDDEDDEYEAEIEFTPDQEAFLALGDEEALAQIDATTDPEELAAYLDAEQKSAAPRKEILTAIGAKA